MKTPIRLFAATAAIVALALSLVPASAKPIRPVKKTDSYIGSFDPLSFGVCKAEGAPENIGKICFKVPKKMRNATMAIHDAANEGAGFFFMFMDANGNCVGSGDDPTSACPSADTGCPTTRFPVPRGAKQLWVFPNGPFLGPIGCVLDGDEGTGISTTGTFTVRFTP